jgi:hypothetical protein
MRISPSSIPSMKSTGSSGTALLIQRQPHSLLGILRPDHLPCSQSTLALLHHCLLLISHLLLRCTTPSLMLVFISPRSSMSLCIKGSSASHLFGFMTRTLQVIKPLLCMKGTTITPCLLWTKQRGCVISIQLIVITSAARPNKSGPRTRSFSEQMAGSATPTTSTLHRSRDKSRRSSEIWERRSSIMWERL